MDGHGYGEEDDDSCLQVVRCSKGYVPSLSHWTLQALRSLTCQSSFFSRRTTGLQGRRVVNPVATVVPLLHRSFSRGLLSSGHVTVKADSIKCCSAFCPDRKMRDAHIIPVCRLEASTAGRVSQDTDEVRYSGRVSSFHGDGSSTDTQSLSFGDSSIDRRCREDDTNISTDEMSPIKDNHCLSRSLSINSKPSMNGGVPFWEEKPERKGFNLSELDIMKERFAKLLLGEDMSGGAKGVCTALAISNAITNLSASIFGELWRLQPLSPEHKLIWRRELDWLLCVADHIVELVPSWQKFADGSSFEVMVSKPRADVHTNLPALRKLDAMLMGFLDSCRETEFWYVEQGVVVSDEDAENNASLATHREEEKWWLPTPKVAASGLSEGGRRCLQHQRDCINQVLKAAMAINNQILSEMETPMVYWDSLPKTGRISLGETIYRHITSDYFSPEAVLCTLDLSTEHNAVEVANRIEAAIHIWRSKRRPRRAHKFTNRSDRNAAKPSWNSGKDSAPDSERKALLAGRAESLLLCLKQKFPGLRQSLLDMTKIQYNKDVGQSILESYSRVMESLAFNIIARIDDVLFVDDMTKRMLPGPLPSVRTRIHPFVRRGYSLSLSVGMPFATPLDSPNLSPTHTSPQEAPKFPFEYEINKQGSSEKCGLEASKKGKELLIMRRPEAELGTFSRF